MCESRPGTDRREEPGLQCLLQTIGERRPLTDAEEFELVCGIRSGAPEPLDRLIDANLFRVVSITREFLDQGLSQLDLIAEGTLGLIRAARRFDGRRLSSFAPYAELWIRQTIARAFGELA